MSARAVVALGVGQCVNWGVLYYAFAVLLVPVGDQLGTTTPVVAGAFSLALVASAALAPTIGRWSDRGHAPLLMQVGGLTAAALLAIWALVPGVVVTYVVWLGLGLCMAAVLYEPAFAIVGRAHADSTVRLRALATVTVIGGLASAVFLPASALLVRAFGWRSAVGVLACALAASTLVLRVVAFCFPPTLPPAERRRLPPVSIRGARGVHPAFVVALLGFSAASLAGAGLTSNLVPALGARDLSPMSAAGIGGALGAMQLPGRILLMSGAIATSASRLALVSFMVQATGLLALGAAPSFAVLAGGLVVFAAGAGLTTLVRPHLVQTLIAVEHAGYYNGQLARAQQLARAAGPLAVAWLGSLLGYGRVFVLLGIVLALLAAALHGCLASSIVTPEPERSNHDERQPAPVNG